MKLDTFVRRVHLPVGADAAYAWHARPGALRRLLPPWQSVHLDGVDQGVAEGRRVAMRVPVGPLRRRWVAELRDCRPGRQFRDVAVQGPFAHWDHLHRFEPQGDAACALEDHIEYALPGGSLGRWLGGGHVRRQLQRMFRYRHDTTAADLAMLSAAGASRPLRVAISGASGMIGSALAALLTTAGHEVIALRRDADNRIDAAQANGTDALIHLAGEGIADGRWTAAKRERIRSSRADLTETLCRDLTKLDRPPAAWLCASAIGYYGAGGEEPIDEQSPAGGGFLAEVCRAWEAATEPAAQAGMRVVLLRLGMVLSPRGGALGKMLPAYRCGLGGRIGSGRQLHSWIAIDDVLGAIHHALIRDSIRGPVNLVAPGAVSNAEFAQTLGRVLRRPAAAPLPAVAVKTLFGQMGREVLLEGAAVRPRRLTETGYAFRHGQLEAALRHLLGRWGERGEGINEELGHPVG